jgi:3-methylfumaryl-CoA hydratase
MHAADHLPIAPEVLGRLRAWEGRVETRHDEVTRAPLRALAATLDLEGLEPALGAPVPALWHWLYFLPRSPQSEIGADGHPKLGGFLPPVPLPRRMWAGGRLTWHSPVRVGDCLQRTSSIVSVKHKAGRTGDLIFVVVRHEIATADKLLLTEEQDLVYRAPQQAGEPSAPAQAAPADATFWRDLTPDPVLLFRYSALTFNSHRIHYDRPYATEAEGYPGLVVHGPLLATLLADLTRQARPDAVAKTFSFKAVRPVFDLKAFRVCGRPGPEGNSLELWAQDHEGSLAMRADIEFH